MCWICRHMSANAFTQATMLLSPMAEQCANGSVWLRKFTTYADVIRIICLSRIKLPKYECAMSAMLCASPRISVSLNTNFGHGHHPHCWTDFRELQESKMRTLPPGMQWDFISYLVISHQFNGEWNLFDSPVFVSLLRAHHIDDVLFIYIFCSICSANFDPAQGDFTTNIYFARQTVFVQKKILVLSWITLLGILKWESFSTFHHSHRIFHIFSQFRRNFQSE